MDMSGISKGRIKDRIAALKAELERLSVLVAQYQAAIAELNELLKPEQTPENVIDFAPKEEQVAE